MKNLKIITKTPETPEQIEKFIRSLFIKYANRKSIFDPLSTILPNYWNDITLRAIKNVMFGKYYITNPVMGRKYLWALNNIRVEDAVKRISEERNKLKKIIYKKNNCRNTNNNCCVFQ
jgi:hypothetical protein